MNKYLLALFTFLLSFCSFSVEHIDGYLVYSHNEAALKYYEDDDSSNHINRSEHLSEYISNEKILEDLYNVYKRDYPKLPKPVLLISKGPGSSAAVGFRLNDEKVVDSNLIFLSQRDRFLSTPKKYELFAHEMAHQVLNHNTSTNNDSVTNDIKAAYYKNESDDCISCQLEHVGNDMLTKQIKELYESINSYSSFFEVDTQSIPFGGFSDDGDLVNTLKYMLIETKNDKNDSCFKAYYTYFIHIGADVSRDHFSVKGYIGQEGKHTVNLGKFKIYAQSCFENKRELMIRALDKHFFTELSVGQFVSYYKEHNAKLDILPLEMKTLFSYFINKEDPYTILEYLFKISLAEIKILTKNIDMKKIRFFTTEDEADILAHKILIQTKYRDSLVQLTSHFIGNEKK